MFVIICFQRSLSILQLLICGSVKKSFYKYISLWVQGQGQRSSGFREQVQTSHLLWLWCRVKLDMSWFRRASPLQETSSWWSELLILTWLTFALWFSYSYSIIPAEARATHNLLYLSCSTRGTNCSLSSSERCFFIIALFPMNLYLPLTAQCHLLTQINRMAFLTKWKL